MRKPKYKSVVLPDCCLLCRFWSGECMHESWFDAEGDYKDGWEQTIEGTGVCNYFTPNGENYALRNHKQHPDTKNKK